MGTKLNVIHDKTVSRYDTETHRWDHWPLPGSVLASSWLPLSDGRVLKCGGITEGTGKASDQCVLLSGGLAGQSVSLGSLSRPRPAIIPARMEVQCLPCLGCPCSSAVSPGFVRQSSPAWKEV